MTEQRDYRSTVFLPKTDFPMKAGLPQKEPGILAKWQESGLYEKLRAARAGREKFILHDGPPYANGDMHIGHALNHILKDMVVRTQSLLGKDAPYVPGWDCHGLPIEWKVEEQYRKQKKNKDEVDPVEFRAECRAYAQNWVNTQREQLKRLGINGDWDHPYLTMDFMAEATIVSELLKFAESGQLYRGAKPVMWSPVEKTALAEAEVEYEDIVSTQIDLGFEIVEAPQAPELVGALAVIWTTTPWTIPVNQAIAYGPGVDYQMVEANGRRFVVAEPLLADFLKRIGAAESKFLMFAKGPILEGAVARHPMHALGGFFARPRPFLPGDFVTTESGTGLVHMAPDHGEDDFLLCKAHGIDPVFAVEGDGKYRADWAWLGGEGSVINPKFNAPDGPVCTALTEAGGLLAASADYKHSYPHSWRSKAKVIFRCTPQWFVPMDRELPESVAAAAAPADVDPLAALLVMALPVIGLVARMHARLLAAPASALTLTEMGLALLHALLLAAIGWLRKAGIVRAILTGVLAAPAWSHVRTHMLAITLIVGLVRPGVSTLHVLAIPLLTVRLLAKTLTIAVLALHRVLLVLVLLILAGLVRLTTTPLMVLIALLLIHDPAPLLDR